MFGINSSSSRKNLPAGLPEPMKEIYTDNSLLMPGAVEDVIREDRTGQWFERSFTTTPVTGKTHLDYIYANFKPLADYARDFHAFFVVTVTPTSNHNDVWTFMPAGLNDPYRAADTYNQKIQKAVSLIVVDPGTQLEAQYLDTKQLGLQDEVCPHGHIAYDVSADEGIRWDSYSVGRGKMLIKQEGWVDWYSSGQTYDYKGPETELIDLQRQRIAPQISPIALY